MTRSTASSEICGYIGRLRICGCGALGYAEAGWTAGEAAAIGRLLMHRDRIMDAGADPGGPQVLAQRIALGEPDHILVKDMGRLPAGAPEAPAAARRDPRHNGPRWPGGAHCRPSRTLSLTPRIAAWIGSSRELMPARALT